MKLFDHHKYRTARLWDAAAVLLLLNLIMLIGFITLEVIR